MTRVGSGEGTHVNSVTDDTGDYNNAPPSISTGRRAAARPARRPRARRRRVRGRPRGRRQSSCRLGRATARPRGRGRDPRHPPRALPRRRGLRGCTAVSAAMTGTPSVRASTIRQGNAVLREGATSATAAPKAAARSRASSVPRTCRRCCGMPAAAARSATAGSCPPATSVTTTGRSRPEDETAARPAARSSDGIAPPTTRMNASGSASSRRRPTSSVGIANPAGAAPAMTRSALGESRRDLAEATGVRVRRNDDGVRMLDGPLEHRLLPAGDAARELVGGLPCTQVPHRHDRLIVRRARGRAGRAARRATANGSSRRRARSGRRAAGRPRAHAARARRGARRRAPRRRARRCPRGRRHPPRSRRAPRSRARVRARARPRPARHPSGPRAGRARPEAWRPCQPSGSAVGVGGCSAVCTRLWTYAQSA